MKIEFIKKIKEVLEEMSIEIQNSSMRTKDDIIKLIEERIDIYEIPSPGSMFGYLQTEGWIREYFESNIEYKFKGKIDDVGNIIILVIPQRMDGDWEERILKAINLICAIENKTYKEIMKDINNE